MCELIGVWAAASPPPNKRAKTHPLVHHNRYKKSTFSGWKRRFLVLRSGVVLLWHTRTDAMEGTPPDSRLYLSAGAGAGVGGGAGAGGVGGAGARGGSGGGGGAKQSGEPSVGTAPVASAAPSLRRLHAPSRDTDSEDDDEAATASAHGHVPGTAIRGAGDTGGAAGGGGAGGGGELRLEGLRHAGFDQRQNRAKSKRVKFGGLEKRREGKGKKTWNKSLARRLLL